MKQKAKPRSRSRPHCPLPRKNSTRTSTRPESQCQCSPLCPCRNGVKRCRCRTLPCPILCQCRPRCQPECECYESCESLKALLPSFTFRNSDIEVLTKIGEILDKDERIWDPFGDSRESAPGYADAAEYLSAFVPGIEFLWSYRFTKTMSEREIGELLLMSQTQVHTLLKRYIGLVKKHPEFSDTQKKAIIRCLREGFDAWSY
jgi:hypothetical protein